VFRGGLEIVCDENAIPPGSQCEHVGIGDTFKARRMGREKIVAGAYPRCSRWLG
jgi:hypothetical protein